MAESINAKYIQKRNKLKGYTKAAQKTDLKYGGYGISMAEKGKERDFRWGKVLEHASAEEHH